MNIVYIQGGYKTRKHQNKRMNWITAKEAIDFLKAHSNEKKKVYIAFYGGEPLLEENVYIMRKV